MKITTGNITLSSTHALSLRDEVNESLSVRDGRAMTAPAAAASNTTSISISRAASSQATAIDAAEAAAENDPVLLLIKQMVEMLTGYSFDIFRSTPFQQPSSGTSASVQIPVPQPAAAMPPPAAGFSISYDYQSVHEEQEQSHFAASGTIRTADGRRIQVSLTLDLARHFREETNVRFRAGDAARKDPLMLNFDGLGARLLDGRINFDLYGTGKTDAIPLLGSGSAYLALDRNGNGRIDSGRELFGPASGSGMAELAAYDSDGNGWIDENDPVFQQLRLWNPQSGNRGLQTLAERRVGALYLGSATTPFELRGNDNSDLGAVKRSGIYLSESGQAGALQEIDLSV
ncbi:MAG: hypothetical protein JSR19_00375 [Proteobacteria bacterium]|nr:hypothetical protein [Pseudomonadota bacterium]HQR04020.1 hypothetical protein [Rhodocyclaceae bacterium]